jgi:formamidopyrimidine-DNA glycosylase
VVRPSSEADLNLALDGARFTGVRRRGKYLLFELARGARGKVVLVGHLGMTGRIFVSSSVNPLPKHTAVVLEMGKRNMVFEDTRYFGRLTLDQTALANLGPDPLTPQFTTKYLVAAFDRSQQPVKVKLLDQSVAAGVGNIYASEALFWARVDPTTPAGELTAEQVRRLRAGIRHVLVRAVRCGSTIPLNLSGARGGDDGGLFYFGRAVGAPDFYEERLQVYDRAGQPCQRCRTPIKRIVQAARSTYFCPHCQRGKLRQ